MDRKDKKSQKNEESSDLQREWTKLIADRSVVRVSLLISFFLMALEFSWRNPSTPSTAGMPRIIESHDSPSIVLSLSPISSRFDVRVPGDRFDTEIDDILQELHDIDKKLQFVRKKENKEKYEKQKKKLQDSALLLLEQILRDINAAIHDAYSRSPRVMTRQEHAQLSRNIRHFVFLSEIVPLEMKKGIYTRFISESNLARIELGMPVVSTNYSVYAGADLPNISKLLKFHDREELIPGDDGLPVTWRPSESEVERLRMSRPLNIMHDAGNEAFEGMDSGEALKISREDSEVRKRQEELLMQIEAEEEAYREIDPRVSRDEIELASEMFSRVNFRVENRETDITIQYTNFFSEEDEDSQPESLFGAKTNAPLNHNFNAASTRNPNATIQVVVPGIQTIGAAMRGGQRAVINLELEPMPMPTDRVPVGVMQEDSSVEYNHLTDPEFEAALNRQDSGLGASMRAISGEGTGDSSLHLRRSRHCAHCGKPARKKCCPGVYYCDRSCQDSDREKHYLDCGNCETAEDYAEWYENVVKMIMKFTKDLFNDGFVTFDTRNVLDKILKKMETYILFKSQRNYAMRNQALPSHSQRAIDLFKRLFDDTLHSRLHLHILKPLVFLFSKLGHEVKDGVDTIVGESINSIIEMIASGSARPDAFGVDSSTILRDRNRNYHFKIIQNIFQFELIPPIIESIRRGSLDQSALNDFQAFARINGLDRSFMGFIPFAQTRYLNADDIDKIWLGVESPLEMRQIKFYMGDNLNSDDRYEQSLQMLDCAINRDLSDTDLAKFRTMVRYIDHVYLNSLLLAFLRFEYALLKTGCIVVRPRMEKLRKILLREHEHISLGYHAGLMVVYGRVDGERVNMHTLYLDVSGLIIRRIESNFDEDDVYGLMVIKDLALRFQFSCMDVRTGIVNLDISALFIAGVKLQVMGFFGNRRLRERNVIETLEFITTELLYFYPEDVIQMISRKSMDFMRTLRLDN
jgi:hypothetical protein